ncbi:hypothetical protein [Caudoviricetes sp.]|nr:hypothetical protein [Caudoviricetes sp.]
MSKESGMFKQMRAMNKMMEIAKTLSDIELSFVGEQLLQVLAEKRLESSRERMIENERYLEGFAKSPEAGIPEQRFAGGLNG